MAGTSTRTHVRAAAAQIAPDLTSADGTLARVLDCIRDAGRRGVELIVFPETFLPYYPYFSFVEPPVLQGKAHLLLNFIAVQPIAQNQQLHAVNGRRESSGKQSQQPTDAPAGTS